MLCPTTSGIVSPLSEPFWLALSLVLAELTLLLVILLVWTLDWLVVIFRNLFPSDLSTLWHANKLANLNWIWLWPWTYTLQTGRACLKILAAYICKFRSNMIVKSHKIWVQSVMSSVLTVKGEALGIPSLTLNPRNMLSSRWLVSVYPPANDWEPFSLSSEAPSPPKIQNGSHDDKGTCTDGT